MPTPVEIVKQAINDHIKPAEVLGDVSWDTLEQMWIAMVAVTPSGPLLLMAFKLVVKGE